MPPLAHKPNRGGKFNISGSDVLRFIIYSMGETTQCERTRDAAERVFKDAAASGVLLFKQRTGMWRGCDCGGDHARLSRRIRVIIGKVNAGRERSQKRRKPPEGSANPGKPRRPRK